MNGPQIIENCQAIAARQYEGDPAGAAQHEIELLRTKVLELAMRLETGRAIEALLSEITSTSAEPAHG